MRGEAKGMRGEKGGWEVRVTLGDRFVLIHAAIEVMVA